MNLLHDEVVIELMAERDRLRDVNAELLKACKVARKAIGSCDGRADVGFGPEGDTVFGMDFDENAMQKASIVLDAAIAKAK